MYNNALFSFSNSGFPRSTPWYNKRKPFIARFKIWETGSEPCMGKYVRHICVFGIKDLPFLSSRSEMFANKFILDYEPHALDCMEELHYNKSRDQYRGTLGFDASWYSELDFVKNKVN